MSSFACCTPCLVHISITEFCFQFLLQFCLSLLLLCLWALQLSLACLTFFSPMCSSFYFYKNFINIPSSWLICHYFNLKSSITFCSLTFFKNFKWKIPRPRPVTISQERKHLQLLGCFGQMIKKYKWLNF